MHSRVSFNSYNINAQVNNNLKRVVKQKLYRGGMHRCLPLLKNGRKLVFLSFTNVDPQKFLTWLFSIHIAINLERNAMYDIKIKR
jgi:hypothetical protein